MTLLTLFERAVLETFLEGDHPDLQILREQARALTVTKREMTGVGFYTNFAVPIGLETLKNQRSLQIGGVSAQIAGLKNGAGFVLFVNDGLLDFLEGFTYDEIWPHEVREFRLEHDQPTRDFRFLQG